MWIFIAPFIYIAFCAGASSVLGPADPKVNNPPAKIEKANPKSDPHLNLRFLCRFRRRFLQSNPPFKLVNSISGP